MTARNLLLVSPIFLLLLASCASRDGVVFGGTTRGTVDDDADEAEVALTDLPAAVRAAFDANLGGGTLEEAESMTQDGATVYEADIRRGNDEYEMVVAADGKVIQGPTLEADDDGDDEDGDDDR